MSATFEDWSKKFNGLRQRRTSDDVHAIVKMWKEQIPGDWKRLKWTGTFGYRKNSERGTDRGEQKIERLLLGKTGQVKLLSLHDRKNCRTYPALSLYHNFPLVKGRRGQTIADAFGLVLDSRAVCHPLVIEVKDGANDCWFALVENLKQIKLARANEKHLQEFIGKVACAEAKGTWGLIVAPQSYYGNPSKCLEGCKELLSQLKKDTPARIAFAKLERNQLEIVWSNWE